MILLRTVGAIIKALEQAHRVVAIAGVDFYDAGAGVNIEWLEVGWVAGGQNGWFDIGVIGFSSHHSHLNRIGLYPIMWALAYASINF